MKEYLIRNAMVYRKRGFEKLDVLVRDGVIAALAPEVKPSPLFETQVTDADHCFLFPGLVDVHVHFREPGFLYKETIRTGSMAAARSGFAHVCAMPNLSPVPDSSAHLQAELDAIARDAQVHVYPYGALTVGEAGEEPAALAAMAEKVVAFSDDGKGVQDEEMMRRCMRTAKGLGKIVAAHCEDNRLLRGGYIHDGEYARAHGHRGICSESEWRQVERDLRLAEETGCAYHVCHVSTRESVALIRAAKARGVNVTCETGPHYLTMNDSMLQEDGRFKMNPPIRSEADRQALLAGVLDGTIDMVVTDHAPHSAQEKAGGLEKSLMGVVGLETSFAVLYTKLVKPGILSLEKLLELMHDAPMRRFGVGHELAVGAPADLCVFDLDRRFAVDPAAFASMGKSTPFAGETLYGVCTMTMIDGGWVWKEHSTEK